ncbi:hypothetical protein HYT55_00850 [Candidatus Woesearchaeota archaeon]|nr:hypothetical protein [Candidatus Woesearchaeota archaeon]
MVKKRQDWKKKAITALMSVFILASFAAAVSSVVTNLASAQAEESAQCPLDLEMHFAKMTVPVCFDTTTRQVVFTIENGITIDVEGAIVNIIGLSKAVSIENNDIIIPKTGTYTGRLDYDSHDAGVIRLMKITPKIKINENEVICLEQAVTIGNVPPCVGA